MRFLRRYSVLRSISSRAFTTQNYSLFRKLNTIPATKSGSTVSQICVRVAQIQLRSQRCFSGDANAGRGRDQLRSNERDSDDNTGENLDARGEHGEFTNTEDASEDLEGTAYLTEEEIQQLTKGDPELIRKIKFIQMEHQLGRQEGHRVPNRISMKRWIELLEIPSRGRRQRFFEFLWKTEHKIQSDKRKKLEAQEERAKLRAEEPARPTLEEDVYSMVYGLTRNTIFLRLYDNRINAFFHNRVVSAMVLGQPLVIDCGYDEYMTPREAKNTAAQIEYLLSSNRDNDDPMDIHLCNLNKNSKLLHFLLRRIPVLFGPEYALNVTEKSYLDLFPKRELVYLTPHAREELVEYSENEIYIVGAMVDKSDPRPYSLAKAKKEGLKMKKLPLDRYLDFGSGSGKSLTINQMGNIMLDVRKTKDWNSAFQFVPKRKLRRTGDDDENEDFNPRRERPSDVLTDFELMTKRKGFKGFSPNSVPSKSPNLRTIMSDN